MLLTKKNWSGELRPPRVTVCAYNARRIHELTGFIQPSAAAETIQSQFIAGSVRRSQEDAQRDRISGHWDAPGWWGKEGKVEARRLASVSDLYLR